MFEILLVVFFRIFHLCFSFNMDVENVIIYHDPTDFFMKNATSKLSSFFGTSVLLYAGDDVHTPWIQIGAPRANSPNVRYENPGVIYRCPINEHCEYIEIDKEYGEIDNRNGLYTNKLDGAWIGSVMDINVNSNRSIVCAPRWMRVFKDHQSRHDFRMLGACYWSSLNSKEFHKKIPLLGSNDVFTDYRKDTVYNFGQGEAGFSAHLPEVGNELLLGAPGIYNWKGSTLLMKDGASNENDAPIASKLIASASVSYRDIFDEVRVANARKNSHLLSFGLFGYSVTSGHFFTPRSVHYASGAPRSNSYRGEVLIYDFLKDASDWNLDVKATLQGVQFGEYFGASLASGDLNGDGLDDLFIGAPFRKSSNYNEGRVYLYFGSKKRAFQEPLRGKFIESSSTNAQFGTCIMFLGEMNRNPDEKTKFKYVAVSAPYEDGAGVVYIFTGNSLGFNVEAVQRIRGKDVYSGLRGFGMSISKPADVDGNGYDDVAIGAYQSGHVVLFRSKPLVRITSYFQKLPVTISNEIKSFEVELCHTFTSFRGLPTIEITRDIYIDEDFNRAYLDLNSKQSERIILHETQPSCEVLRVKFRDSWPNAYDPLSLKVTHSLVEQRGGSPTKIHVKPQKIEGVDKFCMRCGVYDSNSVKTITEHVPFVLGCANEAKCISELNFNVKFQGVGVTSPGLNTFILGASNVLELVTTIENKGEKAYLLRVQVDLPPGLSFKQIPTLCEQNKTRISCPVANPLNMNEIRSLSLKLDMDYVNKRVLSDDFLFVNVTLLTNSENRNAPSKMVVLYLKTEADVSITGKSGEQSYSYGKNRESVEFQQIFQVAKYGLSHVTLIGFDIYVPFALTSGEVFATFHEPEGHLEGGKNLIFESEIAFLNEEVTTSTGNNNNGEIRNKRNVDFFAALLDEEDESEHNYDLLGNRTFKLECNSASSGVRCGKISAKFDGSKKSAVVQLKIKLDTGVLKAVLPKNAIIRYVTRGVVAILEPANFTQSGKKPDVVSVSSFFVNDTDKKKVESWVIIVSVVSGLLLLFFLTLCLTKAGFFKRSKKEELEQLKAQTSGGGADGKKTTNADSNSALL